MESRVTSTMADLTRVRWWIVLLEGIAALLIGLMLIFSPGMSLIVLVQILGFYWLIGGILSLVSAFNNDKQRWWNVVAGIIGILAGIAVIRHPLWSAALIPSVLLLFLGIIGIVYGVIKIVQAIKGDGWGTAALGVMSILIGLFMLFAPGLALLTLVLVLGILAIVGGVAAIIMALRMYERQSRRDSMRPREPAPPTPYAPRSTY